jgi:NADH-quinone oxidoreductase subunit H
MTNILGVLGIVFSIAPALIWVERRMLAMWQDRAGPNRVGPLGIFQPVADAVKLIFKEDWTPPFADRFVFIMAPTVIVVTILMNFMIIPFTPDMVILDLNVGVLFYLAMSSLGAYSLVLGGWASNSKYSLIGAMRGASQMITYEVFLGLSLMGIVIMSGSLSLRDIVLAQKDGWFIIPQFLGFFLFLVAALAESHRLPFDLPESESELGAGFHSEYSGMKFGMFFLGEYMGIVLISALITTFFLGGWLSPVDAAWANAILPLFWFLGKTFIFILLFILLRASIPRPRYDQLLGYGWKIMLPLALLNLMGTAAVVLIT